MLGDITPDGKRILLATPVNQGNTQAAVTVVLNWTGIAKK